MERTEFFDLEKEELASFTDMMDEEAVERFEDFSIAIGTVVISREKAAPAAVLTGHLDDDDFKLDWLYVKEEYRHRGIGAELLERIMDAISSVAVIDGVAAEVPAEESELTELFSSHGYELRTDEKAGQTAVCYYPLKQAAC